LAELNHRFRITPAGGTTVLYDSRTVAAGFGSRAVVTLVVPPSNSGYFLNLAALPERSSSGRDPIDTACSDQAASNRCQSGRMPDGSRDSSESSSPR